MEHRIAAACSLDGFNEAVDSEARRDHYYHLFWPSSGWCRAIE